MTWVKVARTTFYGRENSYLKYMRNISSSSPPCKEKCDMWRDSLHYYCLQVKYNENKIFSKIKEICETEGNIRLRPWWYITPLRRKIKEIPAPLPPLDPLFGSRIRIILAQFPLVLCSRVSLYPLSSAGGFLTLSSKVRNSRWSQCSAS